MVKEIQEDLFETEVLETSKNKPVLVDFWAPWCSPCVAMAPALEETSKVFNDKASIIKINVDENQNLALKFNIKSIPTIIIFKNAEAVKIELGQKNQNQLESILQEYL